MSASITPRTDGQTTKIARIVADVSTALKEQMEHLLTTTNTKTGAQKFIENADEFRKTVLDAGMGKARTLLSPEEYTNEETPSTYGYLSGYTKPNELVQQAISLARWFAECAALTWDQTVSGLPLPANAEGFFLLPDWSLLAPTYGEACGRVFEALEKMYPGKWVNYLADKLSPKHLRQHPRTTRMLQIIREQQGNKSALVVPGQFGILHRGQSVRRARVLMETTENEFGSCPYTTGIMLLTHPNRLQQYNDLWIDCPGGEVSWVAGGSFGRAPRFHFRDGGASAGAGGVDVANVRFGSASFFLPQHV